MIHLPKSVIKGFLLEAPKVLSSGHLAEGPITEEVEDLISSKYNDFYYKVLPRGSKNEAILLNSCGSGIFVVLNWLKDVHGKDILIAPSNNMYCTETIANLAGYKTIYTKCNDLTMDVEDLIKIFEMVDFPRAVTLFSQIGGSRFAIGDCRKMGIPLFEDCAHAFGTAQLEPTLAQVYSFYATKPSSAGEGGCLVTSDKGLIEYARRFIKYDRDHMQMKTGLNLRISEIQALLIKHVVKNIDYIIDRRLRALHYYKDLCDKLGITYLDCDYKNHNGYKFIITDPRVVNNINVNVTTGKVFGYSLSPMEVPFPTHRPWMA